MPAESANNLALPFFFMFRKNTCATAEEIRIRYRYRDLVLKGKIRISIESAKRIVGPDCAYHLYSHAALRIARQSRHEHRLD